MESLNGLQETYKEYDKKIREIRNDMENKKAEEFVWEKKDLLCIMWVAPSTKNKGDPHSAICNAS